MICYYANIARNFLVIFVSGVSANLLQLALYGLGLGPDLILQLNNVILLNFTHLINYQNVVFYLTDKHRQLLNNKGGETFITLHNHRHHGDFLYLMIYSAAFNVAEKSRCFLKDNLRYAPLIGPLCVFNGSCFLARSLEKDEKRILEYATALKSEAGIIESSRGKDRTRSLRFNFSAFAEGTRITDAKLEHSNAYGLEKLGLEPMKHLLHPRPSGYYLLQKGLGFKINFLLGITSIVYLYKNNLAKRPT